ncbi:hypothetical protein PsorP6_016103 [Peronosclerospora sorghi]|uniref:Uncharacterized protein n=1 Tax=Peronosclerospora sorghi TaxID=230839 RepID=A0ACC0VNN9_9STRA|nr:hypothetical protein PsorP6_016103 [Peronosclerospora sorghi]
MKYGGRRKALRLFRKLSTKPPIIEARKDKDNPINSLTFGTEFTWWSKELVHLHEAFFQQVTHASTPVALLATRNVKLHALVFDAVGDPQTVGHDFAPAPAIKEFVTQVTRGHEPATGRGHHGILQEGHALARRHEQLETQEMPVYAATRTSLAHVRDMRIRGGQQVVPLFFLGDGTGGVGHGIGKFDTRRGATTRGFRAPVQENTGLRGFVRRRVRNTRKSARVLVSCL